MHKEESIYVLKGADGIITDLFEHSQYYKVDAVIGEYKHDSGLFPATFENFHLYEINNITLS